MLHILWAVYIHFKEFLSGNDAVIVTATNEREVTGQYKKGPGGNINSLQGPCIPRNTTLFSRM
jgi:hypothetical protein